MSKKNIPEEKDVLFYPAIERNFWKHVNKGNPDECWEWTGYKTQKGYGRINFRDNVILAHRLSFIIHNQREISPKMCILHSCDNPKCVNPKHLREGTNKDNTQDMMVKGRNKYKPCIRFGENHPGHKLRNENVREIRKMFLLGLSNSEIAKRFGVGRKTISQIRTGETWKEIK